MSYGGVSSCFVGISLGTYSLCEDALITPVRVRRLLHLCVGRFRVDDAVLAANSLAIPLGVVGLLPLEVLELRLELPLQRLDLRLLERVVAASRRIALEELDLILDLSVADLCLRHNSLEL